MHTVELFEHLVDVARQLGYQIRHEYLGGVGGGRSDRSAVFRLGFGEHHP